MTIASWSKKVKFVDSGGSYDKVSPHNNNYAWYDKKNTVWISALE